MRLALVVALVALTASPALADAKPLTWAFVAKTQTDTGPVLETRSKAYPTEDACDTARNDWLRAQRGPVLIVELGDCQPVAVVPARGK